MLDPLGFLFIFTNDVDCDLIVVVVVLHGARILFSLVRALSSYLTFLAEVVTKVFHPFKSSLCILKHNRGGSPSVVVEKHGYNLFV